MAARRAERLVNLVICLLSTRQFLSAERIRDAVPGYEAADGSASTDEAFKRMFERDKAELRDLGIPLETGHNSYLDNEDGYRITRRDYELPPIEFDPAEAAAVGLAARLWQSATLGEPARAALIKLRAAGTDVHAGDTPGAVPYLDASDPSLPALLEAARLSRAVRFDYTKAGNGNRAAPHPRTMGCVVLASALVRRGLRPRPRRGTQLPAVAHQRQGRVRRQAGRFRASGEGRPARTRRRPGMPDDTRVARVWVDGSGAGQLRRIADSEVDGELTIPFTDIHMLARLVAAAGTSARVLEPKDLVDAVVDRLTLAAGTPS